MAEWTTEQAPVGSPAGSYVMVSPTGERTLAQAPAEPVAPVAPAMPRVAEAEVSKDNKSLLYGAGEQLWWIPREEAAQAAEKGLSPVSPERHAVIQHKKEIGEATGEAFITSLGNTALLGLPALAADVEGRERMAELKEANPWASAVGSVAGVGLGLLPGGLISGAGNIAKSIAAKATGRAFIQKGAQVVGEGAAIGLGTGIEHVALKPGEMSGGEVTKELAKHVGLGVALNSLFALGGLAVGKLASKIGPKGLMSKAGTNERQVANAMDDASELGKTLKIIEGAVPQAARTPAVPNPTATWNILRNAVDDGSWNAVKKTPLTVLQAERAAAEAAYRNAEAVQQAAQAVGPVPGNILADVLVAFKNLHVASGRLVLKTSDVELGSLVRAVNPFAPLSPASAYAATMAAKSQVASLGERIAAEIPFANLLSKGTASLLFGGAGYAATGDWKGAAVGILAPWALKEIVMRTTMGVPKAIMSTLETAASTIPPILRNSATKLAGDNIEIISEDEKEKTLQQAQIAADEKASAALVSGMIRAGMDPDTAAAVANGQKSIAEMLLENKNADRVRFSKLRAAASDPRGIMGRIANGTATKEDLEVLVKQYPTAAASVRNGATTILSQAKPSQLQAQPYRFLRKLEKELSARAIMAEPKAPRAPRTVPTGTAFQRAMGQGVKSAVPSNLGKRAFGGMATAGQTLDLKRKQ